MKKSRLFSTIPLAAITAVCFLILSFAAASYAVASAEGEGLIRAQLVKPAGTTEYHYIENPRAICADESNIYVDTFDGATQVFNTSGLYAATYAADEQKTKTVVCRTALFTLSNGSLLSPEKEELLGGVTDVAASSDALYAITEEKAVRFNVDEGGGVDTLGVKETALPSGLAPTLVAASESELFLCAPSAGSSYRYDIYRVELTANESLFGECSKIYSKTSVITAAASPAAGVLIAAHPGQLSRYEMKNGTVMRTYTASERDAKSICASSAQVYILTGDGAIIEYSHTLSNRRELVASASDSLGFYRSPKNVFTRTDALFVADTLNDRVVKLSSDGASVVDFAFTEPVASICDYVGNLYAAHNADAIEVFDADFKHTKTLILDGEAITDLKLDSSNNLYVATASRALYLYEYGSVDAKKVAQDGVDCIAVQPGSDSEVFTLDCALGVVRKLTDGAPERVFEFTCEAAAFTVDVAENFYILTRSGAVVKYGSLDDYDENAAVTKAYESGYEIGAGASGICLSTVKNALVGYGDIIICEPLRHCIKKIAAEAYEVNVIDDGFTPPPITGDEANAFSDGDENRIIRLALTDTQIYEKPLETASPVCKVEQGQRVIVVTYRDVGPFARVLVDDKTSSKLISGYVYRTRLSQALPYAEPDAEQATIYTGSTDIYKYPSRKAVALADYRGVKKGDKFKLLSFVKDYADSRDSSKKWYRIELEDGKEGYILSDEVSVGHYDPVFEYPKVNATIISVGGSFAAPLYYEGDDGKLEIMTDKDLPTGTRVEVVNDMFDASEQYTQIKYLDPERGTLTGYVETKYLKYDGVGIMPVVIAFLSLLVVGGIIIFFAWHKVARNKNLTKA